MAFYQNTSDTNLDKDLLLKQPDIFIMKHEWEGSGTFTLSTAGNDSFAPTVNPSWTTNAYVSTVGLNIMIVDDNNKLAVGKVISNTSNTVTFQAADMTLISDGTTAPTLTAGGTYTVRILTGSSKYAYGDFMGYSSEITIATESQIAEFKYSIPRQLIRQDLLENVEALNFKLFNVNNSDIIKAVFGMGVYGSQTGQTELHRGTASFNTSKYQLTLNVQDVNNKTTLYQFFRTQLKNNGEISIAGEEYKAYSITAPLFRDTLRDNTSVDAWMWRKSS